MEEVWSNSEGSVFAGPGVLGPAAEAPDVSQAPCVLCGLCCVVLTRPKQVPVSIPVCRQRSWESGRPMAGGADGPGLKLVLPGSKSVISMVLTKLCHFWPREVGVGGAGLTCRTRRLGASTESPDTQTAKAGRDTW